ncbi:hypothetical protein GCM10011357_34860 [Lacimicrobium alkaliphilum]|uniref:Transposase n=1 Tax=Lacimicrobium alkaliphilum TaxID=1526571 RepID=A0ABQ1RNU8_9ALTE|nr:hypothetical protein GCM10011357_34860 [Lacimicrobium alkaliphilum]
MDSNMLKKTMIVREVTRFLNKIFLSYDNAKRSGIRKTIEVKTIRLKVINGTSDQKVLAQA